jgi:hypothetical protein
MIDPNLKAMLDGPLANALAINLPMGRRAAKRGSNPVYEGSIGDTPLKPSEVRQRRDDAKSAKLVAVLDYYATTAVPFDRIADHCKMSIEDVTESMARRGRTA